MANLSFSILSNFCCLFSLQHKHMHSKWSLAIVYSRVCIHVLPFAHLISWIPSARLLTIFDNLAINLALSINCSLWGTVFVISIPFLLILVTSSTRTRKFNFFSVFSPKQLNCSYFCYFYYKMIIIVRPIMTNYRDFFRYAIL